VCRAVVNWLTWIRCLDANHAPLGTTSEEDRAAPGAELAQCTASIDPLEHCGHQSTLEVGAWWKRTATSSISAHEMQIRKGGAVEPGTGRPSGRWFSIRSASRSAPSLNRRDNYLDTHRRYRHKKLW
jgi:hypothetical protein